MSGFITQQIRRRIKSLFGYKVPTQLWIAVTYDCQCSCEHCVVGPELNKNAYELSRKEIQRVLHDARNLGFRQVSFFGGEPLMRNDLPELINDAYILGLKSVVYTNGIFLAKEHVARLKKAGLDQCNVSIDSSNGQVHDQFRHYEGCFDKAINGIKYLVDEGIPTSIWTHASKEDVRKNDLRGLKDIIRLGRDLKISHVMILFPMASGNWLCGWSEILNREERDRIRELLDPPFVRLEFPDEMTTCKGGRLFVYVKPEGSVTPCPTIPHIFGNVRHESLEEILRKIGKEYCNVMSGHHGDCVYNDPSLRDRISIINTRGCINK